VISDDQKSLQIIRNSREGQKQRLRHLEGGPAAVFLSGHLTPTRRFALFYPVFRQLTGERRGVRSEAKVSFMPFFQTLVIRS
jgi:hypothetical protein